MRGRDSLGKGKGLKKDLIGAFVILIGILTIPTINYIYNCLKFKSDHRVLVVSYKHGGSRKPSNYEFKYQAAWSLEQGFTKVVEKAWHGKDWLAGVESFKADTRSWSRQVVGNIIYKKQKLLKRLEGIDRARQRHEGNGLYRLEVSLWKEYYKLSYQEELTWYQRSRCQWLQFGDKNTRFYHMSTKTRQK